MLKRSHHDNSRVRDLANRGAKCYLNLAKTLAANVPGLQEYTRDHENIVHDLLDSSPHSGSVNEHSNPFSLTPPSAKMVSVPVRPSLSADSFTAATSENADRQTIFWVLFGASSFLAFLGVLIWIVLTLITLPVAIVFLVLALKERDQSIENELMLRSNQGDALAQYDLACRYSKKNKYEEAIQCYTQAAENGHVHAQFTLGLLYKAGNFVQPLRKNTIFGEIDDFFENIIGFWNTWNKSNKKFSISVDSVQAVHWFSKAAVQGLADAQYELGLCYQEGNGVLKDIVAAMSWLRKAADQRHTQAQEAHKRLARQKQEQDRKDKYSSTVCIVP